jgi:hypothetical protein
MKFKTCNSNEDTSIIPVPSGTEATIWEASREQMFSVGVYIFPRTWQNRNDLENLSLEGILLSFSLEGQRYT